MSYQRRKKREKNKLLDRLNIRVGDIFEDCGYHPVRCTMVNYEEDSIEGVSLLNGSSPRGCSLYHCGVRKLTQKEADRLVNIHRTSGERGLMNYHGWSNARIDDFMKEWR